MPSLMYAELEDADKITGSGVSMTETRADSNYSALDISIAFDKIIVHCGSGYSMTIVGDDNIVPFIITMKTKLADYSSSTPPHISNSFRWCYRINTTEK